MAQVQSSKQEKIKKFRRVYYPTLLLHFWFFFKIFHYDETSQKLKTKFFSLRRKEDDIARCCLKTGQRKYSVGVFGGSVLSFREMVFNVEI